MSKTQPIDMGFQPTGRHSILPANIYADVRMIPTDIHILGMLAITGNADSILRREGYFQIAQGKLGKMSGVSRSTIRRSVLRLKKANYLIVRKSKTDNGGVDSSFYKIVYDDDLSAEFDRWLGAKPAKNTKKSVSKKLDQIYEQHESSDGSSVPPACISDELIIKNEGNTDGSPEALPCVTSEQHSNKDIQDGLESTTSIDVERIEFETPEEQIVEEFLSLREKAYPNARCKPSSNEKLLEQASSYLSSGLTADHIIKVLSEQIQITSQKGLDAPNGLTRFKNDLNKAVREHGTGPLPPQCQNLEKNNVQNIKPITTATRKKWEKATKILLKNPALSCWVSTIKFAGIDQKIAKINVQTATALTSITEHSADILSAFQTIFGDIENVEIVKR